MAISAKPPSGQMYELHKSRAKKDTHRERWSLHGLSKRVLSPRAWPILGQFFGLEVVVSSRAGWIARSPETNKNRGFATLDDLRLLWTTLQNPTHNRLVVGSNPVGPTELTGTSLACFATSWPIAKVPR